MEFTSEFKQEVYNTLQYDQNIEQIMSSLEINDGIFFRFQIELIIDTLQELLSPRIIEDDGSRLVWNSMVNRWFEVNKLYSDFMDKFIKDIPEEISKYSVNSSDENNNY